MRPTLASENPKSIIRRTAMGTTSVAPEAMASAISASTIRVRWTRAYGASGLHAPREARDLLPPGAADDIARSAAGGAGALGTGFSLKSRRARSASLKRRRAFVI